MLARLALLFVLVPLLELALLVWIGERVGLLPTVALVVVTGILGAALARRQGLAAWRRFRAALAAGRPPHREIVEGLLVLVAGAVLLTPGLLTDAAGFLLMVPAVRRRAARWIGRRVTGRLVVVGSGAGGTGGRRMETGRGDAVEADYVVVDDDVVDEAPGGKRR